MVVQARHHHAAPYIIWMMQSSRTHCALLQPNSRRLFYLAKFFNRNVRWECRFKKYMLNLIPCLQSTENSQTYIHELVERSLCGCNLLGKCIQGSCVSWKNRKAKSHCETTGKCRERQVQTYQNDWECSLYGHWRKRPNELSPKSHSTCDKPVNFESRTLDQDAVMCSVYTASHKRYSSVLRGEFEHTNMQANKLLTERA